MQKIKIVVTTMALCVAVTLCSCVSVEMEVIRHPNGVQECREYKNGRIARVESFYLNADNKKILHGKCEEWNPPGEWGTGQEYRDGVLFRSYFTTVNQ